MFNVLAPRTYQVSCQVAVGEKEAGASSTHMVGSIDFNETNPINKEIGVLKSKSLAEQTLARNNFV